MADGLAVRVDRGSSVGQSTGRTDGQTGGRTDTRDMRRRRTSDVWTTDARPDGQSDGLTDRRARRLNVDGEERHAPFVSRVSERTCLHMFLVCTAAIAIIHPMWDRCHTLGNS